MKRIECKHCGKEMVFESEVEIAIFTNEFDCSCAECSDKINSEIVWYENELDQKW